MTNVSVPTVKRSAKRASGVQVKLRPADPFDLIRWLARSQSDPRKAIAEFVQNSLDAGATRIEIERRRIKRAPALFVRDNGEGVLPDLDREEALRYIASHIGHSRKMNLTPLERREKVVAGKYGVGLLGFWAIGKDFELRSRVRGSGLLALRLREDEEGGSIAGLPLSTDAPATFTEVAVINVHDGALRALGGGRLASYLGSELRGQLLGRDVQIVIRDGMARGGAQQRFVVVPRRYLGEELRLPPELQIRDQAPARVELYVAGGADVPAVQLACAGTVVADDFRELEALGLAERPWVGAGLTGVIDFPDLNVPPGTRRGVVPDEIARRFADAVDRELRPLVLAELDRLDAERQSAAQRDVARDLRKALRGMARRLPQYDLPGVRSRDGVAPDDTGEDVRRGAEVESEVDEPIEGAPVELDLFPVGPLAAARIAPEQIAVPAGSERRVRVVAFDADGRKIDRDLEIEWLFDGACPFEIRGGGRRPAVSAAADVLPGATGRLFVRVVEAGNVAGATATVSAVAPDAERDAGPAGIPEPEYISDPGGTWRSRLLGPRWQVNEAHEDFVALRAEPRARLRYLLALFAKEVVNRSFGMPGSDDLLERMVEILAHAERNLRGS